MLRRYASGFTGSTMVGDRLLEACLCAYCDGDFAVDLGDPVIGMFRLFHDFLAKEGRREWPIHGLPRRAGDLSAALLLLPQGERAVVLLTRTMGFSYAEVADIMRCRETEVRRLALSGLRRLARLTARSTTVAAARPVHAEGSLYLQ